MGFFEELKRRNVVRVGIAYGLIAWVLLQAADFFLDVIDAPNWIIQTMLLVAVIGLVAVLLLAWIFELTPEGIKLERDVDRGNSITRKTGRRLDRTIIVFLALVVAWFLFDEFYLERRAGEPSTTAEQQAESGTASVAVLPFVNMSNDPQNEYFSDGLTETLLHMLAQLPDLQVAARTSSFAFKGQNKSVSEIAEVLGVAHILEGSVQKAGDRVRVTAQLVRANDGFHVWSQNYTRPLEDIFAIQDEIAGDVADALGTSLLRAEQSALVGVHTSNVDAYDSWLKGLEEQAKFSYVSLPMAELHFREALVQDPSFQEARLSLIRNYLLKNNTGLIGEEAMRAAVTPLLARVRQDDPDSLELRALELAVELSNWSPTQSADILRSMIEELQLLLVDMPTDTFIRMYVASIYNSFFDDAEAAREVIQAGLMIDPLSAQLHADMGQVLADGGHFDEARQSLQRSLELEPDNPNTYMDMRRLERRAGNLPAALDWARRAIEIDPQDHELAAQLGRDLYRLRLPEAGDPWFERVRALAPGSALALHLAFERAVARDDTERAIEVAEVVIRGDYDDRQSAVGDTLFGYVDLMSSLGRSREAFDVIVASHPGVTQFDQLPDELETLIMQWCALMLMTDFEAFETRLAAWSEMSRQMDERGFPWRDPEGTGPTYDRVMHGDIEAATQLYLEGPLQRPLSRNLLQIQRRFSNIYGEIYADPRVAARLSELDRDFDTVRTEVIAMLDQPEWNP